MRNILALLFAFYFAAASVAFPYHDILPRQNRKENKSESITPTSGDAEITTDSTPATTGNNDDRPQSTDSGDKNSGSKTSTRPPRSTRTKSIMVDPQSPPGGVSMQTPAITDGVQYYKYGANITFAWNYTNVIISPTAVNVLAVCTQGGRDLTWTITSNMTVKTSSIVWDTKPYSANPTSPLIIGTYTLVIYDASQDRTAAPSAGYLASSSNCQFGMYSPRQSVPLKSYECAVCENSAAVTSIDPKLMRMVVGTSAIFLLSFFWFARGSL